MSHLHSSDEFAQHPPSVPGEAQPVRRTLAERGFHLPGMPPKVGHARLDRSGQWSGPALIKATFEFLHPDLDDREKPSPTARYPNMLKRAIDAAAEADGWPRSPFGNGMCYNLVAPGAAGKRDFAAWLGVNPHDIWPHLFDADGIARSASRREWERVAALEARLAELERIAAAPPADAPTIQGGVFARFLRWLGAGA